MILMKDLVTLNGKAKFGFFWTKSGKVISAIQWEEAVGSDTTKWILF